MEDAQLEDSHLNNPTMTEHSEKEEMTIQSIVDKTKLLKLMKCSNCQEIPFPPTYGCRNGHIICKDCRYRPDYCKICRATFGEGRNFAMEGIIRESSFTCSYKDWGCPEVIQGADFRDHIERCKYNPSFVLCNEQRGTPCNNAKIGSKDYFDHLKNVHKYDALPNISNFNYRFSQVDDDVQLGKSITTNYFEYCGEAFLQKWQFKDGAYYTWICVLNKSESKLKHWRANVTLEFKDSVISFSSILTLHEASKDLTDVKTTGSFMCLLPSQTRSVREDDGFVPDPEVQRWDHNWDSTVQIQRPLEIDEYE